MDSEPSGEDIRAAIETARANGQQVQMRGAGSKSFLAGAGANLAGTTVVSTGGHRGICEYRPEELVITARTGTPLAEIATTLAEQRQMLPFEPPEFAGGGTLGGAIAAGLSGPGRPWYGAARDAVLGVEMINGLAQRLRFGGQVMKNVAGYDVARLVCGSGGALGALLSVSVRVRPCPEKECTVGFQLDRHQALARVIELGRQPWPISATCHTDRLLSLRLSGSQVEVDDAVERLGGDSGDPGTWTGLKNLGAAFFAELAGARLWSLVMPFAAPYPRVDGRWLTEWGGGRRWLVTGAAAADVMVEARRCGGYARCFSSPDESPGNDPELLALISRIKTAFDPDGVFIPGCHWGGRLMQTRLPDQLLATSQGRRADEILRSCVHCGFCNATCPTYLELGNELDGPRGRIYLIKAMLEDGTGQPTVRHHLDRCLTCRACETTCPSGVAFGELLEIGREVVEASPPRSMRDRFIRRALLTVVPRPRLFAALSRLGHLVRWLLPGRLRQLLPPPAKVASVVETPLSADRGVVVLEGCVQRAATPDVNVALRRVMARNGVAVTVAKRERCCGGLALHLGDVEGAKRTMVANVAALEADPRQADPILSTASGCGVTVKDYGRLLGEEPDWREAAEAVANRTRDAAEYVLAEDLNLGKDPRYHRVAWQAPCTLQHGQQVRGTVEALLQRAGYELVPVDAPHLCCGSAGTYSTLQPELAGRLRQRKLGTLVAAQPDVIATANVGCQLHLSAASDVPVLHWLELIGGEHAIPAEPVAETTAP